MDLVSAYHAFAYGPYLSSGDSAVCPRPGVRRPCCHFLGQDTGGRFARVFDLHTVSDGDEVTLGELKVSFAEADHPVPTVASRWTDGHRVTGLLGGHRAEGRGWPRLVRDAHLFLCEASLGADPSPGAAPHHLAAGEAGRIAREQGARRLMLTHIPPHIDVRLAVSAAERTFDRPVALAVPGAAHRI